MWGNPPNKTAEGLLLIHSPSKETSSIVSMKDAATKFPYFFIRAQQETLEGGKK